MGWCKEPKSDFGFVHCDEDLIPWTPNAGKIKKRHRGYQADNWGAFTPGYRQCLVDIGRAQAGLNTCELRQLETLCELLQRLKITDANAVFAAQYGYVPQKEDGIFPTPPQLISFLNSAKSKRVHINSNNTQIADLDSTDFFVTARVR
jgi:hypothetical protein